MSSQKVNSTLLYITLARKRKDGKREKVGAWYSAAYIDLSAKSQSKALHNPESGSWLAWANDIAALWINRTSGHFVQPADIPPLQSAPLDYPPVLHFCMPYFHFVCLRTVMCWLIIKSICFDLFAKLLANLQIEHFAVLFRCVSAALRGTNPRLGDSQHDAAARRWWADAQQPAPLQPASHTTWTGQRQTATSPACSRPWADHQRLATTTRHASY